jgi:hypothetical protein
MKSFFIFIFIFIFQFAYAQDDKIADFNQDKLETIELIKKSLAETKALIQTKENQAKLEKDNKQKIILESDLKRLKDRYSKIKLNLVTVITDIKIDEIKKPDEVHKRDLLQEAQELLGPALDTIQRISAKPRKIEALKKELATYQEKIALTDIALKNIESVTGSPDFKTLVPDLESYIEEAKFNVNDLRQELIIKVEHINRDLSDLTKDDKSMLDATTSLVRNFLSTKGKNLTISTIIFFLTIWSIGKLRSKYLVPIIENNPEKHIFKTIHSLYGLIAISSATVLSILTLYLLGDWVLVTFLVLFITGTLWAFKDYIRKLTAEGRLILNLGAIKEGDLIIYSNLPWKVKNISFITTFENTYLDTPLLRVEIAEILKMHSRKAHPQEPWFPSKSGDWVLLADGTYGQVKLQTVEQVIIEIAAAQKKYYSVAQYIGLAPTNLSHGFVIDLIWGLDYQDQAILISSIIPTLNSKMKVLLAGYSYPPSSFSIDFHSAAASSLNINVLGKFSGEFANQRPQILKDLQSILLTICTEENLKIPFNQLVVRMIPDHNDKV